MGPSGETLLAPCARCSRILSYSVRREMIVIALISCFCLKDQLGLYSVNCYIYAMTGSCPASLRVLAASGFCDDRRSAFSL